MSAWITLPQNNVVAGQSGHLSDHDDISSALATLWGSASQAVVNACAPPYGAVGDGVTDNTIAINSAIAAAAAAGGGTVDLGEGTFNVSGQVNLASYVRLRGAGSGVTVIHQTATTVNGLGGTDLTNVTIGDLSLTGPSSGSGVGINLALSVNNDTTYLHFVDVRVANFGSHGIELQSPETCHFDRINVSSNGADGWHVYGSGTSCKWDACYALNNASGIGYHLIALSYSKLDACAADSNSSGYSLSGCTGVTLSACGTESNSSNGYTLSGGAGNKLDNCFVYANNNYGAHVTSSEANATIVGFKEGSATGSAVNSILVDAGTSAVVENPSYVTAASYAPGTTYLITPYGASGQLWAPEDNGLLVANYDPAVAQGSLAITAGVLYLIKLVIRRNMTITDLWWLINGAGSGASSGSYAGLYSSAGALLSGSADIASALTAAGPQSTALTTPQAAVAGSFVWAALLSNLASSQPSLHNANSVGAQANAGLTTAAVYRFATNGTGRTTLPSSITPSSNSQTSALTIWAGAS